MPTYKTPNVYVEEISKFPPSVAPVATAVPAFIGYTQQAEKNGKPVDNTPVRIKSLLEYEQIFGLGPSPPTVRVDLTNQNTVENVKLNASFYLYDSIRLFYANGGGNCYVVSIGDYTDTISQGDFKDGIDKLLKEDEPTILLFPDAVKLTDAQLGTVQKHALAQCKKLMDRVAVLDVKFADPVTTSIEDASKVFRNNVGGQNLDYGAAYIPYIETTLPFSYSYQHVDIYKNNAQVDLSTISTDSSVVDGLKRILQDIKTRIRPQVTTPHLSFPGPFNATPYNVPISEGYSLIPLTHNKAELVLRAKYIRAILETFLGLKGNFTDTSNITLDTGERNLNQIHLGLITPADNSAVTNVADYTFGPYETYLRTLLRYDLEYATATGGSALGEITAANFTTGDPFAGYDGDLTHSTPIGVANLYKGTVVAERVASARPFFQQLYEQAVSIAQGFLTEAELRSTSIEELLTQTNPIYARIVTAIAEEGVIVPPSGAIAGIYATVDNTRGVFKAPANISLNAVMAPAQKINNNIQDDLNVDATAGKSINAIRAFNGKGTLVWGARTLAGNSNEWRYINVRRFFNFAEESIKKATEPFIFEPNDANTWAKVKSMISNFLVLQWRDGALQGAKPEHAFYVRIGLGETMTALDILEGRMIVEIGMAVVRPAEFIILRFTHKLPES